MLAFGSVPAVRDLQLIRNGAAHRNRETLGAVRGFAYRYRAFRILHPLQALFWVEPVSGVSLWRYVTNQMLVAAENVRR